MSYIVLTEELETIKQIEGFEKVRFIFLFGSVAEGLRGALLIWN